MKKQIENGKSRQKISSDKKSLREELIAQTTYAKNVEKSLEAARAVDAAYLAKVSIITLQSAACMYNQI